MCVQKSDTGYWSGFLPVISIADIKPCQMNELKSLESGFCRAMIIKTGSRVPQMCYAVKGSVSCLFKT